MNGGACDGPGGAAATRFTAIRPRLQAAAPTRGVPVVLVPVFAANWT
jgi:hypothetical protein